MKYSLSVEVKLAQLPDDDEATAPQRPGDDPMATIGGVLTKAMSLTVRPQPFDFARTAGFDFRKQTEIRLSGFDALAQIVGRFDSLVQDIETEKLS